MKDEHQKSEHDKKKKPNFLFLMVDEQRFPTVYENKELKQWRKEHLLAQEFLREHGMEFNNHYVGSTACSPSRTTLFTGQYPSLHGVTQTSGAAKSSFDPDMFWLDPNSVPTMGDYFRAGGYRTFWKGKWHISDGDIIIPGTNNSLLSYNLLGMPNNSNVEKYLEADRLEAFGFSGWIGPDPHGASPRNSASSAAIGLSGRDVIYASETIELIETLEKESQNKKTSPWLIMCSLVNPHDIALYGELAARSPLFNFEVDPSVPFIPKAPTADEALATKPTAQESYRQTYPKALQPLKDSLFYRQLYFSLHKKADEEMQRVLKKLQQSAFCEDTIIIFLSDHGDLLGAHGGLFQKWYNTYEEAIHVPFIIHYPKLFAHYRSTNMLTSHVDVLPTMLGLAGIDVRKAQEKLQQTHTEVHRFVGRDLTPLLHGKREFFRADEDLYFMSDDDVTRGLHQVSLTGESYDSVVQPNHTEAIITTLPTGNNGEKEIWKLTRYYDNPQFWSDPGISDVTTSQKVQFDSCGDSDYFVSVTTTKETPAQDEFELYNLTQDALEERNLAYPAFLTPELAIIKRLLMAALQAQCKQKRLSPQSGTVPGMPTCE